MLSVVCKVIRDSEIRTMDLILFLRRHREFCVLSGALVVCTTHHDILYNILPSKSAFLSPESDFDDLSKDTWYFCEIAEFWPQMNKCKSEHDEELIKGDNYQF